MTTLPSIRFLFIEVDKLTQSSGFKTSHYPLRWVPSEIMRDGKSYYQCTKCNKSFSTILQVNSHYKKLHLKLKAYQCAVCGHSNLQYSSLDYHVKTKHPSCELNYLDVLVYKIGLNTIKVPKIIGDTKILDVKKLNEMIIKKYLLEYS